MKSNIIRNSIADSLPDYDPALFSDALDLFMEMGQGQMEKYMYNSSFWDEIVKHSSDYYIPKADRDLIHMASPELSKHIPSGSPFIDFGVGSVDAIKRNSLPIVRLLQCSSYYAVDFCNQFLQDAQSLQSDFGNIPIIAKQMDFFIPDAQTVSDRPGLGLFTGSTIGNLYGALRDDPQVTLTRGLRHLIQLTNEGWLLLSIDTNKDKETLIRAYNTPLNGRLHLSVMPRIAQELPMRGFDSSLFIYEPEWRPESQVVAHMIIAQEAQEFTLGNYQLAVQKGQRLHLFNSYKFNAEFFENCCATANISLVKRWDHESPMKLYLLKSAKIS